MAEATHNASRWLTRPVSAVTSPPPPRRATSSFDSESRSKVAGPRLETSTRGTSAFIQVSEDLQPVAQQARGQEMLAHMLFPGTAELTPVFGLAQEPDRPIRAFLGRLHQVSGGAVLHLQRDPADVAADERAGLPQRLGHGQ